MPVLDIKPVSFRALELTSLGATTLKGAICAIGLVCGGCEAMQPPPAPESGLHTSGMSGPAPIALPDGSGSELFVEDGLADRRWNGELAYTEPGKPTRWADYTASLYDNTLYSESISNGFSALARADFRFTATGSVEWLDHQGELFGRCKAAGNTLSCTSERPQRFQISRDFAFYEYLVIWRESGSLDDVSYEREGVLYSY